MKFETASEIAHKMGSVDDQNSVAHRCMNLASQFQKLSKIDRNSLENAKSSTFLELRSFLNHSQEFTKNIQKDRELTHQYIREKLDQINDCLQAVHEANVIALASPTNPMAGAAQQRAALNKLSQFIDFHARQESDGTYTIYTDVSGEQRLVFHNQVAKFNYEDNDIVSPQTVSDPITITLNNTTTDATSILLKGHGEISAHLYMRDVFLPALQLQMDQASTAIVTQFNAIHNMGTSTVLRSTITGDGIPGTLFIDGTETLGAASGTVRFALMDADYKLNAGSGNVAYIDVDLSGFGGGTINDFVTYLNAAFTPGAPNNINIQVSITGGQFTLSTTDT
ncbi:MAG: hypothetical protein Q8K36_06280, partial [Alphaproteobacteria bacterium]|nr:hypothetical protein [Alphaproteobacteria bacterium]